MNRYFEALEFNAIIDKLKEHALSERAKSVLSELSPYLNEDMCKKKMAQTTAARLLLDACGSPPLPSMNGLEEILTLADAGVMLVPEQLSCVAQFAVTCKRTASYLRRGEAFGQDIAVYGRGIEAIDELQKEIESCVGDEKVFDEASSELRNIRRKTEHVENQIKEKLSHILQSRKQYLADSYISKRNGHYVLPVQRCYQNQFSGTVIEVSGKGSTVFMEPTTVSKLQAELNTLFIKEDAEVRRILYSLSSRVVVYAPAIRRNMDIMETLDVLFAKAKLSSSMKAHEVEIGGERKIKILGGRHPLLSSESCVPLDFIMDEDTRGVVITGPNTGGKTVAVKTVGLLSLMAQCGLHIPCEEGSYIAMHDGYLCDIGDSQNISQNLSTFSGHITNVIDILAEASRDSLVLLDELGSGTDPSEGMGIAVAVLDELRLRGCMFLVTTHYPQVKTYAKNTQGIKSARMAFDPESLKPLFILEMGKSGESCALHIAKRLGLAQHLLDRAYQEVYGEMSCDNLEDVCMRAPKSRLVRSVAEKSGPDPLEKFCMGDSVFVLPEREIGIVFRPADKSGDVIVQVKGVKRAVKHTRLELHVPASDLYPPDYDFSVIFDTVENRKASKIMGKHNDKSVSVTYEKEDYKQ